MGGTKKNRRRTTTAHTDKPAGAGPEPGSPAGTAEIGRRGKWTAAGAARAARTARIDTAAHLRRAEVAHRWEMTKVVSGMDLWREHLRAQAGSYPGRVADAVIDELARDVLLGGSGVAQPYPVGLADAAQAVLDRRADDLDSATLYVVSPSMCDVVIAAAQTLTLDDLALLGPDDLPSPTGLIVLPFPLIVRTVGGGLSDDRAYLWHTPAQVQPPQPVIQPGTVARTLHRLLTATALDGRPATAEARDAVRFTSFMDAHGPVRPDSFRDMAAMAAADGTPLPPLLADSTRTLPFQPTITDATREAVSAYTAVAREHGEHWRAINAELGIDEGDTVIDTTGKGASFTYQPGDEIDDVDDLFAIRFLYAFSRLCSQQIAQLDDADTNHSAQLQADRAGVSPEVRVVTIRTGRRTGGGGEPAARDWHHRWVVRMHKVRQWYPSEQRHKILYRGPYVKGPADKPLLGGDVVRSMT